MVGILHVASRPGGVEILLAASCFRNLDKLRQLWASLGSKASLQLSCRTGVIFGVSFRRTEASAKRESRARGGVRIRRFCRLKASCFRTTFCKILQNGRFAKRFAKWPLNLVDLLHYEFPHLLSDVCRSNLSFMGFHPRACWLVEKGSL